MKSFWYFAGGCFFVGLMILVATAPNDTSSSLHRIVDEAETSLQDLTQTVRAERVDILDKAGQYPLAMQAMNIDAQSQIEVVDTDLAKAQELVEEARMFLKSWSAETHRAAREVLTESESLREAARAEFNGLRDAVNSVHELIQNPQQAIASAQQSFTQALSDADLNRLRQDAAQAIRNFPDQNDYIQTRLDDIDSLVVQAQAAIAELEQPPRGQLNESQIADFAALLAAVEAASRDVPQRQEKLSGQLEELYRGYDKLLVDMGRSGGSYRHVYRIVESRISDPFNPDDVRVTSREETKSVSSTVYDEHRQNRGMTIERKPLGKFDHEVETIAQPPGYGYMADPSVGRNRYGYWDRSDGRSFWVWYGQYRLMSDLFWGPRWGRVYQDDYRSYNRAWQARRPYYGATTGGAQRFGTAGTQTKRTFGGSRYSTSRSTSSSRSFRGGRSTGSRSFGGK